MAASGLAFLVVFLAFANGSNDISKGVATLVGSGVSNFRAAVAWGAVWTVGGALLAAFASQGLVATFSGKGFLEHPVAGLAFPSAVTAGAAAWVLFATRRGLPVSTTHALAGALAGAAIASDGAGGLHWGAFAAKIALPLALSPVLSLVLVAAAFPLLRRGLAFAEVYCVCIERRALATPGGTFALAAVEVAPVVAAEAECEASPTVAARVSLVDGMHWLSAALTSLARGLNDTPKVVALGVLAAAGLGLSGSAFYAAVALGMGAGSLVGGLRVTETLARKVTAMTPVEGFAANAVTAALVGLASSAALPVSTTHVSAGSILGIGLHRGAGSVRWATVRDMLLAWLVTLPVAAVAGFVAFRLLARA